MAFDERRIINSLHDLHRKADTIMADLTALNAAIATLQTDVANVQTYIESLTNDQPQVDAATQQVDTVASTLAGLVPAPPTPEPTTEPPVA